MPPARTPRAAAARIRVLAVTLFLPAHRRAARGRLDGTVHRDTLGWTLVRLGTRAAACAWFATPDQQAIPSLAQRPARTSLAMQPPSGLKTRGRFSRNAGRTLRTGTRPPDPPVG